MKAAVTERACISVYIHTVPFCCNYRVHRGAEESSNSDKWPQSFKSLTWRAAALPTDRVDMWIKVKHTGLTLRLCWSLWVSVWLSRSCESVGARLQRWLFLTFCCSCFVLTVSSQLYKALKQNRSLKWSAVHPPGFPKAKLVSWPDSSSESSLWDWKQMRGYHGMIFHSWTRVYLIVNSLFFNHIHWSFSFKFISNDKAAHVKSAFDSFLYKLRIKSNK